MEFNKIILIYLEEKVFEFFVTFFRSKKSGRYSNGIRPSCRRPWTELNKNNLLLRSWFLN